MADNPNITSDHFTQEHNLDEIQPALTLVKDELRSIGAGDNVGLYLSIIETHAGQTDQSTPPTDSQMHANILNELNRFNRKLIRSPITRRKIQNKLLSLSNSAQIFIKLELTYLLGRTVNLSSENWTNVRLQNALGKSVKNARRWVRQPSGQKPATGVHQFCRDVMLVYAQITGSTPGLGGSSAIENYMTPFEGLWLASLKLISPNATILQAREILRRASNRR
jgi:hypothetical protein